MADGTRLALLLRQTAWLHARDVATECRRHETLTAVMVRHTLQPPPHVLAEYRQVRARLVEAETEEAICFADYLSALGGQTSPQRPGRVYDRPVTTVPAV